MEAIQEKTINDNRTVYQDYLRSQHPRLTHLPDYGLQLDPQLDARCRAQAEAHGIDYDRIKREFPLSYQVIPPHPHKISRELIKKNAIPLNALPVYFEGMISGAIFHEERQARRATPGAASEDIIPRES